MIGTPFHLLLFAIFAGVGGVALHKENGSIAGMALTAAGLLALTWLRYAGVMAAGRAYRGGRPDAAWRELSLVPFGGLLLAGSLRAYYRLLRAAILVDRGEWAAVLPEGEAVLAMTRSRPANHATAHGAMAKALVHLGEAEQARRHLELARSMPHKPALDTLLADVAHALEKSGA